MTVIPPPNIVYGDILGEGGDQEQAEVGAALTSGIESSTGSPIGELSGGIGPAAGLFQFEPGTWLGSGGGTYAPTAADASIAQQIAVFIKNSAGDNFGAWGPDLGGSYGYSGAPEPGSPVASKIAQLSAAGDFGGGPLAASGAAPGSTAATLTSLNANPFDLFGIPQTAASDLWSSVGPFVAKATLVVAGLGIIIVGLATSRSGEKIRQGVQGAAPLAEAAA